MRILNIGSRAPQHMLPIRILCEGCLSELEITPYDVQWSDVGHPYGEWINCPICKNIVDISERVPKQWWAIIDPKGMGM